MELLSFSPWCQNMCPLWICVLYEMCRGTPICILWSGTLFIEQLKPGGCVLWRPRVPSWMLVYSFLIKGELFCARSMDFRCSTYWLWNHKQNISFLWLLGIVSGKMKLLLGRAFWDAQVLGKLRFVSTVSSSTKRNLHESYLLEWFYIRIEIIYVIINVARMMLLHFPEDHMVRRSQERKYQSVGAEVWERGS